MVLGKFDHDLNQRPKPTINDGERKVNYPKMTEPFRLVKYDNLPQMVDV